MSDMKHGLSYIFWCNICSHILSFIQAILWPWKSCWVCFGWDSFGLKTERAIEMDFWLFPIDPEIPHQLWKLTQHGIKQTILFWRSGYNRIMYWRNIGSNYWWLFYFYPNCRIQINILSLEMKFSFEGSVRIWDSNRKSDQMHLLGALISARLKMK